MEKMIEVLAYHGWGYDDAFWFPLKKLLPEHVTLKAARRGYYGNPKQTYFENEQSLKVIFAHSYGLHWVHNETLKQADVLFMFASFHKFLPDDPEQKKYVMKVLDAMINKIEHQPYTLLEEFWKKSQQSEFVEIERVIRDINMLKEDLKHLFNTAISIPDITNKQIVMLEASEDEIFVNSHMKEFTEHHKTRMKYKMMDGLGHAFPFTNPEETYSIITKAMPIFASNE